MLRCKSCSFHKQSCKGFIECNFTSGRGDKSSDVMIIFDAPFHSDLQSESIFSDEEYNGYLNQYLEKIDLNMNSVYVTSLVKCLISNKKKKPTKPMKQKCVDLYLAKEIKEVKPKVIFLIGRMTTQWFISEINARVPLKQIIGKSFFSDEYNCHLVPVYDMFYLTNFSNHSSQVRQTETAFATARTLLNKDVVKKIKKIEYSSKLEDLKKLGEYVASDVETTGLDPLLDKIITIALTDVKTKFTVSFDAESYGAIGICPKCKGQKEIQVSEKGKGKKAELKTVIKECPHCGGAGKIIKPGAEKNEFYTQVLPACVKALKKRKIIFHNGSFDLKMIYGAGHDIFDSLVADTRLMQFLLNPLGANSLGFLAQLYYGISYKNEIDRGKIISMEMEDRRYYCAEDTYYTGRLFVDLFRELKAKNRLTSNRILTNMVKVISSNLEYKGIYIDQKKAGEIVNFYQNEKDKYEAKFKKRFELPEEFNLNSHKQLSKFLYEDLNLPVYVKTKSGNPACNEEAITRLANKRPALKTLVEYRTVKGHIEKLRGYLKAVGPDGRIHGSFNLFSPDSSRLMSSKPNIQNVPRLSRIKEIFVPAPGYSYVYYDYSQIEFRIWLHLSNDKKGLEFVNNGRDIHAFIASQFYREPEEKFLKPYRKKNPEYDEKRNKVKTIVYGSMYGRSAEGIVREHGGSVEEAEAIQKIFFQLCREGWMWLKQIEQKVFKDKQLFTPFGTPRLFPDIELAKEKQREEIIRQAKSFIVQSWAVEMVFIGMFKVWSKIRELGLDAGYVHQIHDAGILEVKDKHVKKVQELITNFAQSPYAKLKVPLEAELKTGKSWDDVA